jgi:hypothetical protein
MKQTRIPNRPTESCRILMPATEMQFFCRGCKGHDSRTLPASQWRELRCRCGSTDLLVYRMADDLTLAGR